MLAVDVIGMSMVATGTSGDDVIRFTLDNGSIRVKFNDDPEQTFAASPLSVRQIRVFTQAGNDRITFNGAIEQPITVYGGSGDDVLEGDGLLRLRVYLGDGADTAVLTGRGRDTVYGEGGSDLISTGSGRDYVSGDAGNDDINGGRGADVLFGGDGRDQLAGGPTEIDNATSGDSLFGQLGNDTLIGYAGDDHLNGGHGSDVLNGGTPRKNSPIAADDGDDELTGDLDFDIIRGGSGRDRFVRFEVENAEVIDFAEGVDRVREA